MVKNISFKTSLKQLFWYTIQQVMIRDICKKNPR